MPIELGDIVGGGLRVCEHYNPDFPWQYPAFWLGCSQGHRTLFTTEQIEAGNIACAVCAKEDALYAALQKRNKNIDILLDAGRGEEPDFLSEEDK